MTGDRRDQHRKRYWRDCDRDSWQCPGCGRTVDAVDRADVHHRDEDDGNGQPDNLRGRCKRCHLKGEHDRDIDDASGPSRPRTKSPRGPSRTGPR